MEASIQGESPTQAASYSPTIVTSYFGKSKERVQEQPYVVHGDQHPPCYTASWFQAVQVNRGPDYQLSQKIMDALYSYSLD